ncbi:hypothetical protein J3A83DRAFT_4375591 [Scleroderma citrinum]
MSEDIRDLHQKLGNMSNLLEKTLAPATAHGASPLQWSLGSPPDTDNIHTSATAHQHPTSAQTSTIQLPPTIQFTPNAQSPLPTFHSQWMWFSTLPVTIMMASLAPMSHSNAAVSAPVLHSNITVVAPPPSLIGPQRTAYSSIPPKGMLIPNVPVIHKDNMQTPRTESWKDIIHHWTEGEEWLSLTVLLKDWPHSRYNGPHGQKFNLKYYQQKVVAMEYLDEFHENEKDFLKAYGSTTHLGHTSLLKAILAACKEYPGNGECHCHLINETQGDSSPPGSVV